MAKYSNVTPSFGSRLNLQSRGHRDEKGDVWFEHNSWLEIGETVVLANSEQEATVVDSRYRNPLNRQELVTVLVRYADGSERRMELPASGVRRLNVVED